MKITSAEFIKSAFERVHWPGDHRPEIAFLGRSNVGKSSLINSLLGRKRLARTSNTPGRTQSINFFLINGTFYFVDLPGYGFAKVPKQIQRDWGKLAEDYLAGREQLALCIQLIDTRHRPTELDRQLHEWLASYGRPSIIAATKADKLSSNQLRKSLTSIESDLAGAPVIACSSATGRGRDRLWEAICKAADNFAK